MYVHCGVVELAVVVELCEVPVSSSRAVVVVWALRVRADVVLCRRGGLARCSCIAIVTLHAKWEQRQRRRRCAAVAYCNFCNPLRSLWGVQWRCLQVSPLLSHLQQHMTVCDLSMYVEWQRWTCSACDGIGFAAATLRGGGAPCSRQMCCCLVYAAVPTVSYV